VTDPVNVSERVKWAVVLRGGYVVSAKLLLHGRGGGSVAYRAALKSKRKVWLSDSFIAKHEGVANVIRSALHHAKDQRRKPAWSIIASEAEFKAAKDKAVATKRPLSVLGVVTKSEKKAVTP